MRIREWLILLTVLFAAACSSEKPTQPTEIVGKVAIIPQPQLVERLPGFFALTSEIKIIATGPTERKLASSLNQIFYENCGFQLETVDSALDAKTINLSLYDNPALAKPEEYLLRIEWDKIQLTGSERGIFYGIQSLAKLLPSDCSVTRQIPAIEIYDSPRFPYRGMHLDVARHFMPPDFIKRYIRILSRYKFNYFHWHLTDDQGWRLEIKKYPLLTSIGSKRAETVVGKNYDPYRGDRVPIQGFYTQEQIRDIVEFARRHYITIIPEIDMPGHASAALAAYPNLGCRENYQYRVKTTWGGFPDILCPSEDTFQFVGDVLDEVIEMFPNSPYIHIGADEVNHEHWGSSTLVKELMRANGFKTQSQVYSWFLRRVGEHVNYRGRKVIGWDEMLDAPDPPNAVVMSWQGTAPGVKAANSGREVIMSPNSHVYFDRPQSESPFEPLALGAPLSLREVYNFDPVPSEIDYQNRGFVLGGQGCAWTEFIKRPKDVEYMVFPRAIALAEVLWSSPATRNFLDFQARLNDELLRLDGHKINYRKSVPMRLPDPRPSIESPNTIMRRPATNKTEPKTRIGRK